MTTGDRPIHRKATADYRWDGVELLPYKEDDRALFKAITRQTLFSDPDLQGELRYFEMAPDGFSTLERHEHMHAVLILRGRGHCLVGNEVRPVETRDLVTVPPMTWHQFRATRGEPLGFPVHGQRPARQAATADARRHGEAQGRSKDRVVSGIVARLELPSALPSLSRRFVDERLREGFVVQAMQRQPLSLMNVSK